MKHTYNSLFIDGRWVPSHSTEVNTVVSASTEEAIGLTPVGDATDVDAAVTAARRAFDGTGWSDLKPGERADALERFADEMAARATLIAETVTAENGMPITLSMLANGQSGPGILRYHARLILELPLEEVRTGELPGDILVRREPLGVVAAMVPWNYPQALAIWKIAPALAAGCTVVLKPALETALDGSIMAEAAVAAGLPPGVFNVVPGGVEGGQARWPIPASTRWPSPVRRKPGGSSARCADGCCARSPSSSGASPRPWSSTTRTPRRPRPAW
jgi:aldehyde dehydrogenase (NAD+)